MTPVLERSAIAIARGRIAAIGPDAIVLATYTAGRTMDADGGAVHPGFIDPHMHVSQYTSRSVLPLIEGTALTMGDWKGTLRPRDEYASASLAAIDYLRCGYTAFVDPGTIFEPDAVAAVAGELGIRIWLTDPYVADRGSNLGKDLSELVSDAFLARWPKDLDAAMKRLGSQLYRNRVTDGLVRAFIGLYGEDTASPELHRAAFDLARAERVRFQEHRGYLPASYLASEALLGRSAIQHLESENLLGDHVTFVHMNVVHPADVRILAKRRVGIVWCSYGQLQMTGTGKAESRMLELHRAGVPVGIASDIPRAVNFDGLGSIAFGAAAAAGQTANPREIMRMRTIGAAATIGASHEIGSLEVGKHADLVIRNTGNSEDLALDRHQEIAVLGERSGVRSVIVNGRMLVEDGQFVGVDPSLVRFRARQSVEEIKGRIGLV